MLNEFSRTELIIGKEAVERLRDASVIVFGVGGVGSFTVEALARSSVGTIALVDDDKVCLTNINRQLIALRSTVGKSKVEVARDRILDINPTCKVITYQCFYSEETADSIDLSQFDYIVDAIDTVSAKLTLIERAQAQNIPIISCMGCGNKLDPTQFEVTDIYKTSVCPLAKVMRYELKKRGVKKLKVLYSKEQPSKTAEETGEITEKRHIPGSISFVPSVAGLIIGGEVIKDIAFERI